MSVESYSENRPNMPNNKGRTSSTALKGSQMVTVHEPENKIGWTFGYYSFHAVLQRKF